MTRTITRIQVAEAIELGHYLPRFSVEELAKILGISLVDGLRLVALNDESFQFNQDRGITGLGGKPKATRSTSRELWADFVKQVGDEARCLNAQTFTEVQQTIRGKIKQLVVFSHCILACLVDDKTGEQARQFATGKVGESFARDMVMLAEVRGDGGNADKYLYGAVVTPSLRADLMQKGFSLFIATEIAERISNEIQWENYEIEETTAKPMTTVTMTSSAPPAPQPPANVQVFENKPLPAKSDPWTDALRAERDEVLARAVAAGMDQERLDEILARHKDSAPKIAIIALKGGLNYFLRPVKFNVTSIKESIKTKVREETGKEPEVAAVPPPAVVPAVRMVSTQPVRPVQPEQPVQETQVPQASAAPSAANLLDQLLNLGSP